MITIYGSPRSSSGRCFWCLEEVGVPYQAKAINFQAKEHKSEAYLAINPSGKVPALIDGDVTLTESMAINFYLAEAYKPELLGQTAALKALALQWSFWAISELQPPLINIFIQKVFVPEDKRDAAAIEENMQKLPALLQVLDAALAKNNYLAGSDFSLADLNTASVASICMAVGASMSDYPNILKWLDVLNQRPAFKKYQGLK